MCEYCEKIINNKKILDIDNEEETHMEIINQKKSWGYMLYVEIEEQDKIIDLMVNNIATSDNNLCEYLDITNKCQYYAGENKKLCDDCIKQYFENEAKELINK